MQLVVGLIGLAAPSSNAAGPTLVSLTFDDDTISEYNIAYVQALQPHNVHATFFVKSGSVGGGSSSMNWIQIGTLAADGNDIGGKTVSATNLTTDPNPTAQVCNDRKTLLQHGITPIAFAYPGGIGFNDSNVRTIVQSCGYGNARRAGGLSSTSSTNYAEALPPLDWLAIRAYLPPAGGILLTDLQAVVNHAFTLGGGWVPIVLPNKVCPSQTGDPTGYASCATGTFIGVDVLNAFLDWVQNAGQPNQAPAGSTFDTVAHVVTTHDSSAPTTTISCNGAPCSSSPYSGAVTVALSVTDIGSGASSSHYTTDGSDPTLSSPTYTGPFGVNSSDSSTTVKFRSWDYAGNGEATKTQVIQAPPDTDAPMTTIRCNGDACASSPYIDSVTVALSATDTGGSGIDKTYFTTDGSTPDQTSTVYTAPLLLTQSTTVKFFSTDKAGNAEQVLSQQIEVVPHATVVSLTFDEGTISQYTLGYPALQSHGIHATFFVNSGIVGSTNKFISWAQLAELQLAGNDIGGKTVNGINLKTTADTQTKTDEVCNDRKALLNHGLDAVAFAYPFGAFDAMAEGIVKGCGYGNARTAGSLSPSGPHYAETIAPQDWFATRAYAPSGQVTLANMKSLVSGAASLGGGWSQIVIQKVCSQTQEPGNYTTCTAAASWVELADLDAFLDWIGNAGQPGGAPAGTVMATVRQVAVSADDTAPSTTISCDLGQCSGTYDSVVRATLSATDVGSSVASTHYTTDGSDPTLSSPTYTKPIPITTPTTVQFKSWDYAGNAEATQSQTILATPPPDTTAPTTMIACNNAPCSSAGYGNSVRVSLTADDGSGWGVDATYYTIDGSTPTTASTQYNGPFQLTQPTGTYSVKFFSTDLAGNAESVQSLDILVLPPKTVVSLTFDDGLLTQYQLAFLRGLKPRGMNGAFYNISGLTETDSQHMTWSQLTTVNNGGNEIGGHTVNHINLKTTTDEQTKIHEVCDDRQALIQHGFDPTSFAYPFGAYDQTVEDIVKGCGYTTGRAAGGIDVAGDGAGPVYAEPIPPIDGFATRTVYGGAQLTLSHLEAAVTAAAQHGGGWVTVVFHDICSQEFDPDNYTFCINDFGPIELTTFTAFLDWLQDAGQPGGAPPRTVVETVSQVINGPDTKTPVSTLLCDGQVCQPDTYHGSVTLSLSARDPGGSGIKATYFTLDGSTPDQHSSVYTNPFTVHETTTAKFFSVDNVGNVEPVQSQQVQAQPNADPIIGAAGDIACDPTAPAFENGQGTDTDCRAAHTAPLLNSVDAVLPIGDVQYECGGSAAFAQSYDPTWGVKKSITHPVPGDKDYATSGGTDCPTIPGAGYYAYFGSRAGDPSKGYYSYDLGTWHVVALNTAPCPNDASFCAAGSAQEQWLVNDLATHSSATCTLAYYQNPRWTSTSSGGSATYQAIWQELYAAGVDVVLNGDSHWYERFQPMDSSGNADATYGVREFIVGTGGAGLDTPGQALPTSVVRNGTTHGVIRITLRAGGYDWTFVHDADGAFSDSGSGGCHSAPPPPDTIAPITTIACNDAACQGSPYTGPVTVTLSASDAGGSGVDATYYTLDGSTPTLASTIYTGPLQVAQSATIKFFSTDKSGNAEQVNSRQIDVLASDTASPTTTISCNGAACGTGWYNTSPVSVTLAATDAGGSGVDKTYYTTDGSTPTTSSTVYAGTFDVSATATVMFFSTDKAGNAEQVNSQQIQIDTVAPATSIACNGTFCQVSYSGTVSVTLSTVDTGGSGVDKTYYTTNGSTPTTSSAVYAGPFTVSSTTTVKFFSTDKAGNTEQSQSQQIQIQVDAVAPTTTIACSNAPCQSFYRSSVSVSLSASDTGGSGVDKTYYTTNGSTPTTSSGVYAGPFTVSSTRTVKFFSTDKAGNTESERSQTIGIDSTAPTTTISCDGGPCSGWRRTVPVTVTLSATDGAGSGVKITRYTTDGTTPTLSNGITYAGPFTLSQTTTVRFRSWDNVGNVEGAKSQNVRIDAAAPTITITAPADGASFTRGTAVTVNASATDSGTGSGLPSGVAKVTFYLDGTTQIKTDQSSPYSISWNTRRVSLGSHRLTAVATDVAGNSASASITLTITG